MSPWLALELFLDFALPALLCALGLYLIRGAIPRKNPKTCHNCNYNLTGASSPTCPECGHHNEPHPKFLQRFKFIHKRRALAGMILCIPFLWILWLCVSLYSWALPQQLAATKLQQPWPSGAAAKVFRVQTHHIDLRNDSKFTTVGLWLARQVLSFSNQPHSEWDALCHTEREWVGLNTYPKSLTLTHWSLYAVQWVFWPEEHYRRYVPRADTGFSHISINKATRTDQRIFELLPAINDFWNLQITQSYIDGHAIKQIGKVPDINFLTLDSVHATPQELQPLSLLPKLVGLEITFKRTVEPADIVVISRCPNLGRLSLSALAFSPQCDTALANLITNSSLLKLELQSSLPMQTLKLTTQAAAAKPELTLTIKPSTNLGQVITYDPAGTQPAPPINP